MVSLFLYSKSSVVALEAINTAEVVCTSGKATIKATFKNNESSNRYTYVVIPTDRQTDVIGDAKTVNPNSSETWELNTTLTKLNRGTLHFDIQRVDDIDSKIFRLVQYEAIDCANAVAPRAEAPTPAAVPADSTVAVNLDHQVKLKGSSVWLTKINNVNSQDEIEILVKVTNKSTSTQSVTTKVELPSELRLVSGELTNILRDIPASQSKEVKLVAKLASSATGQKCVISRATVEQSSVKLTSGLATVCYGGEPVTSLPTTGPTENMLMTIMGLSLISSGLALKKFPRLSSLIVK